VSVVRLEEEGKKNRFHQQQRHLVTNTRVSAVRLEEIERNVKVKKKKKKKRKREARENLLY